MLTTVLFSWANAQEVKETDRAAKSDMAKDKRIA
jgi:hypothetical protein